MPNQTKNKKGSKSSQGKRAVTKDKEAVKVRKPVNYTVVALCCAAVALLLIMSFFAWDGFFLTLLERICTGLFGRLSYYLLPFVLIFVAYVLLFNRDDRGGLKLLCGLGLVVSVGAIEQFFHSLNGVSGLNIVPALFNGGFQGRQSGVICGLLYQLFAAAFSGVGALVLFILLALVSGFGCVGVTVVGILRAVKSRTDQQTEQQPRPDPNEVMVQRIVDHHAHRVERKKKISDYDIPVDDTPAVKPQKRKASYKPPAVPSPDAFIELQREGQTVRVPVETFDEEPITGKTVVPAGEPAPVPEPEIPAPPVMEPLVIPPVKETKATPVEEVPVLTMAPGALEIPEKEKITAKDAHASAVAVAAEIAANETPVVEYRYPPLELLRMGKNGGADGTSEMRENSQRLADALKSFKIDARMADVIRGPSVTRYEVELERGVRLSKITALQNDLALSVGAPAVRISAIPDKISVVGIEVPNKQVTMVPLREVIGSSPFARAKSRSSFAVGKDIGGDCIVGDIAKLPHLLIAGTTGSGKSVCMNSIIISILYKAKPDEVKLIMVDPKMVELGIYNGIPHLLIPVVTDPKKAAGSLQWAVTEMMRRYKIMSDAGVRDMEAFNAIVEAEGEGEKLAQIVVVIDELADLMLVAAKEVEESICRIAQMGRAAGMHLIIATQRPSADVITGLMKANIPSRIAFAVASAMESRIILDTPGAEKLVGKGDMLYAPLGCGKPKRVQGCFVSDAEVESVTQYVKSNFDTNYSQEVMEEIERKAAAAGSGKNSGGVSAETPAEDLPDGDELLPAAVDVILETGQASVSMLQRRLKLGYARAARIVDEMEEKGIVGPFMGSKPRQILVTKEQWAMMQNGQVSTDGGDTDDGPVPEEIP